MRAILVLYMVAPVANGGLAFDTKTAASIYGTYTMSVYLMSLPGGLIADRILGARLAVLLGGIIIACGHFSMILLAPAKVLGIMMGVWFLAASLGNKLAGYFAGFFNANDAGALTTLYGAIAIGLLISAGILAALTPAIRRMMGGVR